MTDKQFMTFVDQEVTPDFPDDLTVQTGRGQWRDATGKIEKERSYELILLYPVASGGWTIGPWSTSDGMSHVPGRLADENYRR